MIRFFAKLGSLTLLAIASTLTSGCVERTVKIDTRPTKAMVVVNDEEVGMSPVKFSFKWYGDYDLVLRKEGYETLKTNFRLDPPWWQLPPFDLVSEVLVAETLRDDHVLEPFELVKRQPAEIKSLVTRAEVLRERSLYGDEIADEMEQESLESATEIESSESAESEDRADSSNSDASSEETEVLQPVS